MNAEIKKTKQELTKLLQDKAERLQYDGKEIPDWVITVCADFIESKKPTKEMERLHKAEQFLCANTNEELTKMIKLVESADADEIIDYIEGVEVWEKVQFSFTVKQFLEQIS